MDRSRLLLVVLVTITFAIAAAAFHMAFPAVSSVGSVACGIDAIAAFGADCDALT